MPLDLEPGDVYAGGIRIKGVLGVGSFARVYEVEVPGYACPLALKLTREPVTAGGGHHAAFAGRYAITVIVIFLSVSAFSLSARGHFSIFQFRSFIRSFVHSFLPSFFYPLIRSLSLYF